MTATPPDAVPARAVAPASAAIRTAARFAGRAMASPLALLVHGVPGRIAAVAWDDVVAEFEAAEQAMSRFRETSDLTRLNRSAAAAADAAPMPATVDPRLRRALVAADRARRLTGGLFDPRIVRDLERLGDRGVDLRPASETAGGVDADAGSEPGADVAADARVHPPSARVLRRCEDGRVALDAPVDLGGIGKGLALRWAAGRLRARLVAARRAGPRAAAHQAGFLLEAGGDLIVEGPGPEGGPWVVAIEDPAGATARRAIVAIRSGAVATSSVRIRRWRTDDGRDVHHLIDPRTGEPGGGDLRSVTVAAADPAWAEVRSKTLFLLGSRRIGPEARRLGLAAWWVDADGRLGMTPAARPMTIAD